MKCEEVKLKIRPFLEDLLPESDRLKVREHLQECALCRQMSGSFGFLSADLRKITEVPLSPELKLSLIAVLEQGENKSSLLPEIPEENKGNWGVWLLVLFLCLGLGGMGYFFYQNPHKSSPLKQEIPKKAQEIEPALLEEALPQSSKVLPLYSGKRSISLKPLHWDVYFSSTGSRDALRSQILNTGAKVIFENSGSVVLTLERASLEKLMKLIDAGGGKFQGGGSVRSAHLPSIEGEFRISISLNAPQSRVSQALTHHWHARLQLPNRFGLKDNLETVGARLTYESPELWVVEIPGHDVEQLKEVIRTTNGITLSVKDDGISTENYRDIPVTVSLYLDEG